MKKLIIIAFLLSSVILVLAETPDVYINAPSHNLNQSPYNISAEFLFGDGRYLTNLPNYSGSYVPYSNATQDIDLNTRKLTNVGQLIMQGVITSQDIIPVTDGLYSLGNSINWFKEAFIGILYSEHINASMINTTDLNAEDIQTQTINTTNMTIGGHDMYRGDDGSLNIDIS